MSDEKDTAQGSAATVAPSMKFKDMNFSQKLAHIAKCLLCVASFGFAFPNIFSD